MSSPNATTAPDAPVVTPAGHSNPPRNIAFVREAPARHWYGGDPVATAVFNALSLSFPDGERFFIDAVKSFRHLADGELEAQVRDFITQEALHTREHAAFNTLIDRSHYPVAEIEQHIKSRVDRARKLGSLPMLVITMALEHFTAILAEDALTNKDAFKGCDPKIRELWQWHALEETEHKAVAFDVFQKLSRKWTRFRRYSARARAMAIATTMFLWNQSTYALMLMKADGIKGWSARWKLYNYLYGYPGIFRRVALAYFDWYRPGFHPWAHDTRALVEEWRPKFASPAPVPAIAAE